MATKVAGGIEATLEEMEPGGAIVIVVKIVLAGPEEFDGDAYMLSNSTGFQHVVIGEPTAESAAGALQVDNDVVVGNIENFGDEQAAIFRCLAGRPEFELAVVVMGKAILRLHGCVRKEGIGISSLDGFCGRLQSFLGVPVGAEGDGGRLFGKFLGAAGKTFAALLRGGAFLPLGAQFLAGAVGLPPGVGNDSDATVQAKQIGTSIH